MSVVNEWAFIGVFMAVAGAVHQRPRQCRRGGLVAGQEETEHVGSQLVGGERVP